MHSNNSIFGIHLPPLRGPLGWLLALILVLGVVGHGVGYILRHDESIVVQGNVRHAPGRGPLELFELNLLGPIGPLGTVKRPAHDAPVDQFLLRCPDCRRWSGPFQLIRSEDAKVLDVPRHAVLHLSDCPSS